MLSIYLCGAINGCTDDEAVTWRERVKRELAGLFVFVDPMVRDYRGREDDCVAEIVQGDMADIDRSDIVLVNAERPSWGTAMEIRIAHERGKVIHVVCGADRISPWLRFHASRIDRSLSEAISGLQLNGGLRLAGQLTE